MKHFILIGIDDHPAPRFTDDVRELIRDARLFSGGKRHYDLVRPLLPDAHEWIDITTLMDDVLQRYNRCFAEGCGTIVVFASGDPLFFGFANTLMREMPEATLRILPAFNSLQLLAHRIPLRYDDMRIVSLTGRPWQELDRSLIERAGKIGILTDRTHTPAAIASRLSDYGYTCYDMYIGEHLGNPCRERVRCLTLEEAASSDFGMPNCVILHRDDELHPAHYKPFGLPDEQFEHLDGRTRMITKMPIRLLALQALELPRRRLLWDIGFCTGSVGIEARLQFPHLQVRAFEVRPECRRLMHINSRRFGVPGIEVSIGDFLATDTDPLPKPDAVFIGGHGGRLREMLQKVGKALQTDGCIVFNSVSNESRAMFEEGVREAGLTLCPSRYIALDDCNPITIMKAKSKG